MLPCPVGLHDAGDIQYKLFQCDSQVHAPIPQGEYVSFRVVTAFRTAHTSINDEVPVTGGSID